MEQMSGAIAVLHSLFKDIAQNLNDIQFHSKTARMLENSKDEASTRHTGQLTHFSIANHWLKQVIKKWKSTVVMAQSYMDAI